MGGGEPEVHSPPDISDCGTMHAHLLHLETLSPLNLLIGHEFNSISTTNKHELQKANCIPKSVLKLLLAKIMLCMILCVHII